MRQPASVYRPMRHSRYLLYMHRRTICFFSVLIMALCLGALLCIDLGCFPKALQYVEAANEGQAGEHVSIVEKYTRTVSVYGVIAAGILVYRVMLERMKESFFTAIIGTLATVFVSIQLFESTVRFFEIGFPFFWQRYLLILSYMAFGVFWFLFLGLLSTVYQDSD